MSKFWEQRMEPYGNELERLGAAYVEKLSEVLAAIGEAEASFPDGAPELVQLAALRLSQERKLLAARDIASGERMRRYQPFREALASAVESGSSGGKQPWLLAMAEASQAALSDERPAWCAGALFERLEPLMPWLDKELASAACAPLILEMALDPTAECWRWPLSASAGQRAAFDRWMALAKS